MRIVRWSSLALLIAAGIAMSGATTEAGWWFHKKCCDSCENKCECCGRECEKPRCCFLPPLPPRAGVADAIPGRITTIRADRAAPATALPPPAPASTCSSGVVTDQRIGQLDRDIQELKLKMEAVTVAIEALGK